MFVMYLHRLADKYILFVLELMPLTDTLCSSWGLGFLGHCWSTCSTSTARSDPLSRHKNGCTKHGLYISTFSVISYINKVELCNIYTWKNVKEQSSVLRR